MSSCLDSLCPLSTRHARSTQSHPWLSDALRTLPSNLRAAERKWHKSAAPDDLASYQTLLSSFSSSITAAEKTFYKDKINSATELFFIFKTLLYPPPPATNLTADTFASFFTEKVAAIGQQFDQLSPSPKGATVNSSSFPSFIPLSESEVSKILTGSRPTTCPLDPIPSNILQAISPAVLPAITQVINASFNSGTFPSLFKVARVTPVN